jgi:hypothetical protein
VFCCVIGIDLFVACKLSILFFGLRCKSILLYPNIIVLFEYNKMAAALANPAVMKAAMGSMSSGGDSQAPESECNPTTEQWAAKIQKETRAFETKLHDILSTSKYSKIFFKTLQNSLVKTIESLPQSKYLVRLADQEISRSLIEQFKLDDDFKKIFSYKLLGGQGEQNANTFLIGKIELLITQINQNTNENPSFTFFLKTQREEYLKNVNKNAKDHDIKKEENNKKQNGGKLTKTRKLKRMKIRINTKKKRSRAQSKRSLRRRQRKRRYPRKTMRGGEGIDVTDLLKSVNIATATGNKNIATATGNNKNNEKQTPETGSNKDAGGQADASEADASAANIEQDEESDSDKPVEKNYNQDLLKRLTEMDATDDDLRNIILNLIQIACNITLKEKNKELTDILSNKMQSYIQNVYANLNYSTYDVFGYLIFCSFLFDYTAGKNTEFGNYVDEEIVKLKKEKRLTIKNVKNIFQTNFLKNNVSKLEMTSTSINDPNNPNKNNKTNTIATNNTK